MASISSISVMLIAKTKRFTRRMKRARRTIKKFAGGIAKGAAKLLKFGAVMIGVGVIIATVLVRQVSNFLDNLDKMSKRTGISAQSLAALGQVAELAGANMETLEKGVKRMQKNILDAEAGLTTAVRGFKALGLTWQELKELSPEEQLDRVFEGLANVESASERAAIAQDVMGRAGTALLPILSDGFEAFKALRKESARIIGGITEKQVKDAADFKDRIQDAKAAVMGFLTQNVGFEKLNKLVRFITESVIIMRDRLMNGSQSMKAFGDAADKAGQVVKTVLAGIVVGVTDISLVGMILTTTFDLAISTMADRLTFFFTKSLPETLLFFAKRLPLVFVIRKLPELFNIVFNSVLRITMKAAESIKSILKNPFNVKNTIAQYAAGARTLIKEAGTVASQVFDEVVKDVNAGIDREFTLFEPSVNTDRLSKRFTSLTKQFGKQTRDTQKEIEAAVTTAEGLGLKKLGITIEPSEELKEVAKPDLKALQKGTAAAFKAELASTDTKTEENTKKTADNTEVMVKSLKTVADSLTGSGREVFNF